MTEQPEPIRKSQLPTTPPPEWEITTVGGKDSAVVRRRVTFGDWEPVFPNRWADEPAAPAGATARQTGQQPDQTCTEDFRRPRCQPRHTDECPYTDPAVGQPAEAHDTDRAELRERIRLAVAQWHLDDSGSGRTIHDLDDTEFGTAADAVLSVLPVEGER
ncbi:hypothetical protein [Streptomyces omiyaensis]|uniref:hypothetical protein n=1 Tax=Streptomyces omiyaensis TaxID=68247 RepID=UPI0036F64B7E